MTWVLDSLQDGRLGDFMEHDTAGLLLIEAKDLTKMPADSLSLTVFIGCEPHLLGFLSVLLQFADHLTLLLRNDVMRLKCRGVYAEFFLFQVPDMTITRHHLIVFSQKFLYSLGLRGALYNN